MSAFSDKGFKTSMINMLRVTVEKINSMLEKRLLSAER